MTRKHFRAIADTIRMLPLAEIDRVVVADHFAIMCKQTNPNFKRETFLKACGV